MLKQSISVKDQFGAQHAIQATVDHHFSKTQSHSNIKHKVEKFSKLYRSFLSDLGSSLQ